MYLGLYNHLVLNEIFMTVQWLKQPLKSLEQKLLEDVFYEI